MMTALPWMNPRALERAAITLILLVAAVILFANLDNHFLWQDEAQTALVARTILDHGVPLGHDGRNSFSQEGGAEFGSDRIFKWHPWFSFYLLAGFFKLFGVSTFVARFPFVLFGIGSVLMIYLLAKRFLNPWTAVLSAFLLLLCVPFLLLVRQCRYYSPSIFFALLTLYFFLALAQKGRWKDVGALVLCLGVDAHIQSVNYLILVSTILCYSLVVDRSALRGALISIACSMVFVVPWTFYTADISFKSVYPEMMTLSAMMDALPHYFLLLLRHVVPYGFLLLLLILFVLQVIRKRKVDALIPRERQGVMLLLIYFFVGILLLSFFSVAVFFRYLGPLIPAIVLLMAMGIHYAARMNIVLGLLAGLLALSQYPIDRYLSEITHDYDGPIEGIVGYLNSDGSSADTVAVTYEELPIIFYTGMNVVGGLTGEPLDDARSARWVIIRKHDITARVKDVREFFLTFLNERDYERIELPYPDIPFENREDPSWHQYRTATTSDRVVLYKRRIH